MQITNSVADVAAESTKFMPDKEGAGSQMAVPLPGHQSNHA